MPLRLCGLLWEHARRADDLATFEVDVLVLLPDHPGQLLSRDIAVDRHDGDPREVQLIEFPDYAALSGYQRIQRPPIGRGRATAMQSSPEPSCHAFNPATGPVTSPQCLGVVS